MPTGYTADLCERDVPFSEFVLRCARAFGPLVMMRDDSLDTPIPKSFQPDTYHRDQLRTAKRWLAKTMKMTEAQVESAALAEYKTAVTAYEAAEAEARAVERRLQDMRTKVLDWSPPTANHEGLKRFMLEQLDTTIKYDGTCSMEKPKPLTPMQWLNRQITSLKDDIAYHTKELAAENERVASNNKWVKELRASL